MKNKGFTLIELLAVIVILAIIALIATPIILGIITDARTEAKERSAEAVVHAMETAYLTAMMKHEAYGTTFTNTDVVGETKIDNEDTSARTTNSVTTKDGVTCTLSATFEVTCTGLKANKVVQLVTQ